MAQRKVTLVLAALYVLVLQAWAQLDVSMEDRVEVLLGDKAEIPCMYSPSQPNDSLVIRWFVRSPNGDMVQIFYKDEHRESVVSDTEFSKRINISHAVDGTVGTTVLTIDDVKIKDEQGFMCQVDGGVGYAEGHTKLRVFNTPSFPTVQKAYYTSTQTTAREEIATCEINSAYPAPNITWYKNRSLLQPSFDNMEAENSFTTNPSGLVTAKSVLFLQVVKEDKDAYFYCEVSFFTPGGTNMMESQSFNIEVHYPTTEVTINQDFPPGLVKEGDKVEISCKGNGNPQPILIFEHNRGQLEDTVGGNLVLDNMKRSDSGVYKCISLDQETLNKTAEDSLELMVNYLDPVVITPEETSYTLREGQGITLSCNALSSLPTHTTWYKDGAVLEETHTLNLLNISYDMAGTYICEVQVPSLAELKRENFVNITVIGRPVIVENVTMTILDTEESVNLSCSAFGNPTPIIDWNLPDNQTILEEVTSYRDYAVFSIITIRVTSDVTASCMASNPLGSVQAFLEVKVVEMTKPTTTTVAIITDTRTTKEGSGVIIAVIIILLLLLAILGSVLYFLYKKGKIPCGKSGKQDFMKEKSSKDDVVVEMKSSRSEEAVLLQGVNGGKKSLNDQ